ncbi:MAG TPA: M48 family metalloprotease [Armatimonadota bacterium]|nr:M48 family metalloprotease [Armatimonadota bacterium]
MLGRFLTRALPVLAALSLLAPSVPAAAQQGGDIGREMEREYGVVGTNTREGRVLNNQLDDVVQRIVSSVNRREGGDFRLRSAKILGGRSAKGDKVVNAFALPDGRIYVTYGLMRLIENDPQAEDELAFVVGHEVTHVVHRHSASQAKKTLPINILAGILGIATKNRAVGTVAGIGAAAYSASFSRRDEYDADKGGLRAMYGAGYDPNAAVTMLKRLEQQGGSDSGVLNKWFGSHPMTENRIERVREMAQDLRANGRIVDNEDEDDRDRDRDRREFRRNRDR